MPYIGTGRISLFFEEAGSGGMPVLLLHELGGSSESRFGSEDPQRRSGDQVALKVEIVVNGGVHAEKLLGRSW